MRPFALLALFVAYATPGAAIVRSPTGVNVAAQGASTVFITYGQLRSDQYSVEAEWCPTLIPATPAVGLRCHPDESWGRLPTRHDLSRPSGRRGFTDIMSIPASLARRAFLATQTKGLRQFYYVRRFSSTAGLPDEYVVVTCRLTGGSISTPFALTDVVLGFATPTAVLVVPPGGTLPPLAAELHYTGSGVVRGRWDVVQPGDPPPTFEELLPEPSQPLELRRLGRRWTEVGRFHLFVPPGGRATLPGPDPQRLPTQRQGVYLVLLRLEASPDVAGDLDLGLVGEPGGALITGGITGFAVPPLRYAVGGGSAPVYPARGELIHLLFPVAQGQLPAAHPTLTWWESPGFPLLRLEVQDRAGRTLLTAFLRRSAAAYTLPPFVLANAGEAPLRWRVVPLDESGVELDDTQWESFRVESSP